MYRCQKLFYVVDGHEKTDFLLLRFFLVPAIFSIHEILKKDQKITGAKKVTKVKNRLFHACQPCQEIFEIYLY